MLALEATIQTESTFSVLKIQRGNRLACKLGYCAFRIISKELSRIPELKT